MLRPQLLGADGACPGPFSAVKPEAAGSSPVDPATKTAGSTAQRFFGSGPFPPSGRVPPSRVQSNAGGLPGPFRPTGLYAPWNHVGEGIQESLPVGA
jgi:hypothetical protein